MKRIAILLAGQKGDIMSAMSCLKYKNELWGEGCKIVWYADRNNFELFKHQDIELREFPRGFGYPKMVIEENNKLVAAGKEPFWENWEPLVDENNHMNKELQKDYPSLAEFDLAYFPAPHQMSPEKRHGYQYANCSKKVFGVPMEWEWHPVLAWSDEELERASTFMSKVGSGKIVCWETFAGSGQSVLDESMIETAMNLCTEYWPGCKFIFASHKFLKNSETFPTSLFEQPNVFSCAEFSVRECSLIVENCDLLLSVSSGITVASSAWQIIQPPTLQFCGSVVCSTRAIANGHFELVTYDGKKISDAKNEYYEKLILLLKQYQ